MAKNGIVYTGASTPLPDVEEGSLVQSIALQFLQRDD